MKTVRLTMAQALVRFLENQYIAYDGKEEPFVEGVIMLPGHGNVVGLGQALRQETKRLKVWQGKNEQGMAHTAVALLLARLDNPQKPAARHVIPGRIILKQSMAAPPEI